MIQTVGTTKRNIRQLTNDTQPGRYACSGERMLQLIDAHLQLLTDELNYADTWTTGAVSYAAGTSEYALPAGEYRVVSEVKRHSDGVLLARRAWDVVDAMNQSQSPIQGNPTDYALYEDTALTSRIKLFPTPNTSGTLDMFFSVAPSALTWDDTTAIGLSTAAMRLLEARVAAEIVAGLTPKQADELKMGPGAAAAFSDRAKALLAQEKERTNAIRRTDRIERIRF